MQEETDLLTNQLNLRSAKEWKRWLSERSENQIYGTANFSKKVSMAEAKTRFDNFWKQEVVRRLGKHANAKYNIGRQPKSQRPHIHFTAEIENRHHGLKERELENMIISLLWTDEEKGRGDMQVEEYNKDGNGAVYNEMKHEEGHIETYCPTRHQKKRNRCRNRCCYWKKEN